MKFGYVTNCLGPATIMEAASIAADLDFDCIEVGPSIQRDRAAFREVQANGPVPIQSLIYGRNFLTHHTIQREEYRQELSRLLDIAADIGVGQVTTSTGVDSALDLDGNISAALEFWGSLFEQAAQADIRIALEFCPTAGNFALGPFAWRRLLDATTTWPNFGLNYDPSHLVWQFIEPYEPIREFRDYIFSVHAKDTFVRRDRLAEHGILTPYARTEKMAHGPEEARAIWWENRLPGDGQLDWQKFFSLLTEIGYDGAVMLEHEAPDYMGSRELVLAGLKHGFAHIKAAKDAAYATF